MLKMPILKKIQANDLMTAFDDCFSCLQSKNFYRRKQFLGSDNCHERNELEGKEDNKAYLKENFVYRKRFEIYTIWKDH